jgi:hypothetical protein
LSTPLYLPNLTNTPPGGEWRYKVPETGQLFRDGTRSGLLEQLAAHYRANGYALPDDLFGKVEAFICNEVPEYCGGEARAENQKPLTASTLAHTFHTVVKGTQVLISWVRGGAERVPVEQAEARASVCGSCPENVAPLGCSNCNLGTLRDLAKKIVGSRTLNTPVKLESCRVCACTLEAKVWLPHAILWKHAADDEKSRLPAHCWMKTESQNETKN